MKDGTDPVILDVNGTEGMNFATLCRTLPRAAHEPMPEKKEE
jgi:hypothetical protein